MIGLSMLTFAIFGSPPHGLIYSNFFFATYGVNLIMKDLMLGVVAIYCIIIRIAKWTCWKDFDNTPGFEKGDIPVPSNRRSLLEDDNL